MSKMILAPSLLAADFTKLGEVLPITEENGATYLHFDVMDGLFVPSISFGPPVLQSIKKATTQIIDVHLMIVDPIRYIEQFVKAGADTITVHYEACEDVQKVIDKIKDCNVKVGLSIKPNTPVTVLEPLLEQLDMVLIMTVEPGFGGQSFIPSSLDKIRALKKMIDAKHLKIDIQVDGGIYTNNVKDVIEAGANIIVAGSAIFNGDTAHNTKAFMEILQRYE